MEGLETRRLLSAVPAVHTHAAVTSSTHITHTKSHTKSTSSSTSSDASSQVILFSAAPAAVQSGLQTLAGSTTIDASQKVHTHARPDGTVIYCIKLNVSGTPTTYAVDATGAAVNTAPPKKTPPSAPPDDSGSSTSTSTSTPTKAPPADSASVIAFSDAPASVQTGLSSQAQGTTIAATAKVHTHTRPDGTVIYCVKVSISGTDTVIAVDSTGATVQVPPPPQTSGPQDGDSQGGKSQSGKSQGGKSQSGNSQGDSQTPPPSQDDSQTGGSQSGGPQSSPQHGSPQQGNSQQDNHPQGGSQSGGSQSGPPQGGSKQGPPPQGGQKLPPPPLSGQKPTDASGPDSGPDTDTDAT